MKRKEKKETARKRAEKLDWYLEAILDGKSQHVSSEYSNAVLIYSIEKNSATTKKLTNIITWLTAALIIIGSATIGLILYTTVYTTFFN
ncbi:MAG: hypothetical protein MUP98_02610 [Candidatus Aminicenantes bacterium]|nr:hypothetical protein [Candidatus Aminicenantes bacterium]